MIDNTTTIELPRHADESARAFRARQEYVLMGADRSLDKVRQRLGKSAGYTRQLQEWSSHYDWVESAKRYDTEISYLTVNEAADRYRADLEAHRKKASDSAKNLLALANGLTRIYADALQQPREIRGADGKLYTLHKLTVDTNTLTTISKAMTASLDLEAHALGVDTVLSRLDDSE